MGLSQLQTRSRSKLSSTILKPDIQINYSSAPVFDNVQVDKSKTPAKRGSLRPIVIDGQNVAVEHAKGNKKYQLGFSMGNLNRLMPCFKLMANN